MVARSAMPAARDTASSVEEGGQGLSLFSIGNLAPAARCCRAAGLPSRDHKVLRSERAASSCGNDAFSASSLSSSFFAPALSPDFDSPTARW